MSNQRNRDWWVTGWSRPRPDSPEPEVRRVTDTAGRVWDLTEPVDPEYVENGAAVIDKATGVTYRATIERSSSRAYHLSSLQIDAPADVKIDARFLASVPTERIADAVAQYLDAADDAPGHLVILPPAAVRGRGFVPDLDELAHKYAEPGRTRADVVAEYVAEYDVSRATVDRWISKAREAGLIPPARTGRKSRHTNK